MPACLRWRIRGVAGWLFGMPAARNLFRIKRVEYYPCLALLITLQEPSRVAALGYQKQISGPIALIAGNTQNGISAGSATLTVHSTAEFAREFFDASEDEIVGRLLHAAKSWLGSEPLTWQLHRWKYSQPVASFPERSLLTLDPAPLAFAGDAFGGPRIEGSYLSGVSAAERILALA